MRVLASLLLLSAAGLFAQDSLDARGAIARGNSLMISGNYQEAVKMYQRAVELEPSNVQAHLDLGGAWMQQYIPGAETPDNVAAAGAADREFHKALDLDSSNFSALSSLGLLAFEQKKWDDAQAFYQKSVEAAPGYKIGWYYLGAIAWSRCYPPYQSARAASGLKQQETGRTPDGPPKEMVKAQCVATLDAGLHSLERAIAIDPKYADALTYMNLLLRERADLVDNAADYEREIAEADGLLQRALAARTNPPQPAANPVPMRIRVSEVDQAAKLVTRVEPVYPSLAKSAGIAGTVRLVVTISGDGHVTNVQVIQAAPLLVQAAVDAVRQWIYQPTELNGKPVEVEAAVSVVFPPR